MKRGHKKIFGGLLAVFLIFCNLMPVFATNDTMGLSDEITLLQNEDGSYQIVKSGVSRFRAIVSPTVTASSVEPEDVYYNNEVGYLMRIDEDRFIEATYRSVDPYDLEEFEATANELGLSEMTRNDIASFIARVRSGEITPTANVRVCIPGGENETSSDESEYIDSLSNDDDNNVTITYGQGHTYTGYNNQTYYEEHTFYSATSDDFPVAPPNGYTWADYAFDVFSSAAKNATDAYLNYKTGNKWTLYSIFAQFHGNPSSIPTTAVSGHRCILHENKTRKATWIVIEGEYRFGSRLDSVTDYHYEHFIVIPGSTTAQHELGPVQTTRVDNYLAADRVAYQNYVNGGYVESVRYYELEDEDANRTYRVDSMVP